jgi:zinc protease
MSTLNRSIAPETKNINKLNFPVCDKEVSASGVPVYFLTSSTEQILRVEFVFDAGIVKQHQNIIANAVNALLSEGTKTRTAKQIADGLDYYGSYFQARCAVDDAQLTLYCLKKHLQACLDIIIDVIKNTSFPENELNIYIKNNKQRLKVQQEKTSYLCRKAFYKNIILRIS